MTRVALYARYSSDNQSEASIEDQFRLCRDHARRERWETVGFYEDAAISGASTILRPGIQRLMRDAQHGEFNILLAEALDRISRDQADVAPLYKQLKFAGVGIVTLAEGEISELHVGLKGTMNALFLKDLAMKTRRGLRGRVEKGKAGGGSATAIASSRRPMLMASRSGVTGISCRKRPKSSAVSSASSLPARARRPSPSI
ncbi:recombinase family protein [Mesorhizobium sp. YR577]|uniref:recombinase family protein n=1 Tax=Mesorhizobium sp. YR577 TaxID=1884373 RepID=UPI000B1A71FE|nr:recombinase family protein [Mesorhizobium sp. YR577]